jgi:Fe-S cluster assembly iron-binding protein IscA
LALALDEPKENDDKFETSGVTYLIEKDLLERIGGVKVDFVKEGWRSGFVVSSDKPVSTGPSACGSSCSC